MIVVFRVEKNKQNKNKKNVFSKGLHLLDFEVVLAIPVFLVLMTSTA